MFNEHLLGANSAQGARNTTVNKTKLLFGDWLSGVCGTQSRLSKTNDKDFDAAKMEQTLPLCPLPRTFRTPGATHKKQSRTKDQQKHISKCLASEFSLM